MTMKEYTPWLNTGEKHGKVMKDYLSDYVNSAEFRKALHIPDYVQGWNMCWNKTEYNYQVENEGSNWIYPIMK